MPSPILLSLPFSPWSEQARWALEARGIVYKKRRYEPLLGEFGLRRTVGRWSGPVSVPVLLVDGEVLSDSWDVAKWAADHGDGPSLLSDETEVGYWRERAECGLNAGRALSLVRVVADVAALDELTPRPLRKFGAVSRAMTRAAVRRTQRKYGGGADSLDVHDEVIRGVLSELRGALGSGSKSYVLGEFTYADITMAQVLAFVQPHDGRFLRLGPANRRVYGDRELAGEFADLIQWRDELYDRHRARP